MHRIEYTHTLRSPTDSGSLDEGRKEGKCTNVLGESCEPGGANLNGSARPAACWQSGARRRQLRAVATSLVRSSESTSTNQMQYTRLLRAGADVNEITYICALGHSGLT